MASTAVISMIPIFMVPKTVNLNNFIPTEEYPTAFRRWKDPIIMCHNFAELHKFDAENFIRYCNEKKVDIEKFIKLCEENGLAFEYELDDIFTDYCEIYGNPY